ncbi:hypothetical protein HDV00_002634 [Rhizophlyctis rosea]|nr:hypothetical protein HDV00_002634 [Rhizophlyctis rosea]
MSAKTDEVQLPAPVSDMLTPPAHDANVAVQLPSPDANAQETAQQDGINFETEGERPAQLEHIPQQPNENDHNAQLQQQAQDALQQYGIQTAQGQEEGVQQDDPATREGSTVGEVDNSSGAANNRNKTFRNVAPLPSAPVQQAAMTALPQAPLIMVLPPNAAGTPQQPQYFLQLAQPQQPGQPQQQQQAQQPLQAAFSLPIQFALPGQAQATTMVAPHPFLTFASGQQGFPGGQAIQIQLGPGGTTAIPLVGDGRPGTLPLAPLRFAQHDPSKGRSATTALYPCPHPGCDKSFYRKQNLQSHARCHSEERPYPCDRCDTHFRRKHDLHRHFRSMHADVKPFNCNFCNKPFARSDALRRHLMTRTSKGYCG